MSVLKRDPLNPMFNACVQSMCKRVWPQWFDVAEKAPSSFKALRREYEKRGRITVYNGAPATCIFDDPDINVMFRAWHDFCHLMLDADFTVYGEYRAAQLQMQHVVTLYGNGPTALEFCALVDAEVNGQALYYHRRKEYITDQRAFVEAYLTDRHKALARRW